MNGNLAKETILFNNGNSKKKVTLTTRFPILRKYYVQVKGFGHKIYGNYSKVKTATMNKSVYNKYRKKISY